MSDAEVSGPATVPKVRVICDSESHSPKVAKIGQLAGPSGGIFFDPRHHQQVEDDVVTVTTGDGQSGTTYRARAVLRCPLCSLNVELRRETEYRLARELLASGASVIRLVELCRFVSRGN